VSIDDLMVRARAMTNGHVPSKTRLQKDLGIGWDNAVEVHRRLCAEHDSAAGSEPGPGEAPEDPPPSPRDATEPLPTGQTPAVWAGTIGPPLMPPARRANWRGYATYIMVAVACVVASVGTVAVTVAGFALSFDAGRAVAVAAYVNPRLAWLTPVSVDGLMAVAMVTAVVLRWMGRSTGYPWTVVLAGVAVSIACNAAHASIRGGALQLPVGAAMAVSAIPAASVAASVHMLIVLALAVVQPKEQ
jgi:hypothetical protein